MTNDWKTRMNELEERRRLAWVHNKPDAHTPGTILHFSKTAYERQANGSLVRVFIEPQAQL